jgi:amidohydrolase
MTIAVPVDVVDEVIATRRDLHAHPELGFEEHRTSALVAARLNGLGFEVHTGIGQTGVVGVVRGTRAGKTIMLRADMDGLPIDEENDVPYRSETPVHMHACGHDGHVAILLGAARLVAARRDEVAGTVCFLFQPAEEGKGGAKAMVADGVLERFGIERAYGLHLSSAHPAGQVGFREGPMYASSDSIEITIEGKGGHGAAPHLSIDPVYVASQFVVAVQDPRAVVRARVAPEWRGTNSARSLSTDDARSARRATVCRHCASPDRHFLQRPGSVCLATTARERHRPGVRFAAPCRTPRRRRREGSMCNCARCVDRKLFAAAHRR